MKSISINNISFGYRKNELVFNQVSLDLSSEKGKGLIIAFMGESGCGKTTLLKLLLGIEKQYSGRISMSPDNCISSYVPQEPILFEHLTPLESASYFKNTRSLNKIFNEDLFNRVSNSLGLKNILNSKIKTLQLSGGQKQRISLLRALSIKPDILFLDEPCTGLDQEVKLAFLSKLREITESLGLMVIYITHHFDEAKFVADRICYLVKDEKDKVVNQITNQSIFEFTKSPPSKGALALMSFPLTNLLKIEESSDCFVLKDIPQNYLYLSQENIKITQEGEAIFYKISQSNLYSVFKHEKTENFITLKREVTDLERFALQLTGVIKCFNESGISIDNKNCKILR